MRHHMIFFSATLLLTGVLTVVHPASAETEKSVNPGKVYYVRQTDGRDTNDGLTPQTAWEHVSKLSNAMQAGDTAYVGPGLYREGIVVQNSGTSDRRITFIADTSGRHTGDSPGVVMLTGAIPVDESIFQPHSSPDIYMARFDDFTVFGVVEMDGQQYPYTTFDSLKGKKKEMLEQLSRVPSSYFYDTEAKQLYIHTSDGAPPGKHEIEIIRHTNGFALLKAKYVTIIGFTFRHMGDAGINFFADAGEGVALKNTAYGNRHGIRVRESKNVVAAGNTLFRNYNSGIYFLADSNNGLAISNITYENIKGLRWSSKSSGGVAFNNTVFDNLEAGISMEYVDRMLLRRNSLINNKSQLFVHTSTYDSDENCFESKVSTQATLETSPPTHTRTLAEYQELYKQDMRSQDIGCNRTDEKIDVMAIHKETMTYLERFLESQ